MRGRDDGQRRQPRLRRLGRCHPGADPLRQHAGVMAHLAEPDRGRHRAHALAIRKQDARSARAHPLVGRLHQLAAGCVHRAPQAAGGEFLGGADVEQVRGARCVREPLCGLGGVDDWHRGALRERARMRLQPRHGRVLRRRRILALCVALKGEPGQGPALRAVLERKDLVRHTHAAQRLRTDDGAGAARTVHDDPRPRIRRDRADAQRQLAIGTADAAGNVHLAVFGKGPAVHDHEVVAAVDHGLELGRGDAGRVQFVLDQLAEHLARHIHAGKQREAGGAPAVRAALEHVQVAVAERRKPAPGERRDAVALVAQHDGRGESRHQAADIELEAAIG